MNIGLVVNARGKLCLVHDEEFEAMPLWVGYHVDRHQIEIIFDTGGTFPIEWEATDEMDNYLLKVSKILIIRMENRKPVEGYDTSFLQLRAGHTIEHSLVFNNGMRGSDRFGQLSLTPGTTSRDHAPSRVVYDGVHRVLCLHWDDGDDYTLHVASQAHHAMVLSQPFLRYVHPGPDDQIDDAWIPIEISMAASLKPGDPPKPVDQWLSWAPPYQPAGSALNALQATATDDNTPAEWDPNLTWQLLNPAGQQLFWQALNARCIKMPVVAKHGLLHQASLPWYRDVLLVNYSQIAGGVRQQCFFLWQQTTGEIMTLDLTVAALSRANRSFALHLDPHTACSYLRFAYYFERERSECLLFVQTDIDIRWKDGADENEKLAVNAHLQPMRAAPWDRNSNALLVTATALRGSALVAVKVILALEPCSVEPAASAERIELHTGDTILLGTDELSDNLLIDGALL